MSSIWRPDLPSSEITPEGVYLRRRDFLAGGAAAATGLTLALAGCKPKATAPVAPTEAPLPGVRPGPFGTGEPQTPYKDITTYNNFYELGTDKSDPAANAHHLKTRPWTIAFEGEIARPQVIDVDTLLGRFPLEERVYRLRCVEAWSMVIPWVGFPLGPLIKQLEPTSRAKYVAFTTKLAPDRAAGFMMGIWFVSIAIGNWLAGRAASLYSSMPLPTLFGSVAAVTVGAAIVLAVLVKPTVRLMSGVK